jgi:hypothetical protein
LKLFAAGCWLAASVGRKEGGDSKDNKKEKRRRDVRYNRYGLMMRFNYFEEEENFLLISDDSLLYYLERIF